jgi:hypothetical protein
MLQVEVFWVVMFSVVVGCQHFRGSCCLHLEGEIKALKLALHFILQPLTDVGNDLANRTCKVEISQLLALLESLHKIRLLCVSIECFRISLLLTGKFQEVHIGGVKVVLFPRILNSIFIEFLIYFTFIFRSVFILNLLHTWCRVCTNKQLVLKCSGCLGHHHTLIQPGCHIALGCSGISVKKKRAY